MNFDKFMDYSHIYFTQVLCYFYKSAVQLYLQIAWLHGHLQKYKCVLVDVRTHNNI